MDLRLKGQTTVVSGSTAGIGFAIAATLAAEGAKVVVNGRTEARVTTKASTSVSRTPIYAAFLLISVGLQVSKNSSGKFHRRI